MNKELFYKDFKKVPKELLSFLIMAFGISIIKMANLGMNAWSTLQLGISNVTKLSFGTVSQLIGLIIVIICFFIKIYPGIGTILNMYFIGFFINYIEIFNIIPNANSFFIKLIYVIVGQIILSYGVYMYISCGIGAGPRDGLMLGIVKITNKSVGRIKTIIEICVFTIGVILGGKVGIGTIIVTLSGGWLLNKIFKLNKYDAKTEKQSIITDYFKTIKSV